jgi:hypothetical protein
VAAEPAPVEAAREPDPVPAVAAAPPEPVVVPPEATPIRPVPRTVVVTLPNDSAQPVPPPKPAADHTRSAIVAAGVTIAGALVVLFALRSGDGRVTEESSGTAVPALTPMESLPPLQFPDPDTASGPTPASVDSAASSQVPGGAAATPAPPAATTAPVARVRSGGTTPPRRRASPAQRTRRPQGITIMPPRPSTDSLAFAQERDAIRRELEMRRARLDSIERMLDPNAPRPHR